MLRSLAPLAFVSLSALTAARAQAPAQQGDDSIARIELESRINGQALIRVHGAWGTAHLSRPRLVGDTLSYAPASAELLPLPPDLPRPLTLEAVQRLDVRGSGAGSGALIGAGVGLAAGLAAGGGIAASLCDWGCDNAGGGVAAFGMFGAAGGALLGAVIGSGSRKWVTVYRAPD